MTGKNSEKSALQQAPTPSRRRCSERKQIPECRPSDEGRGRRSRRTGHGDGRTRLAPSPPPLRTRAKWHPRWHNKVLPVNHPPPSPESKQSRNAPSCSPCNFGSTYQVTITAPRRGLSLDFWRYQCSSSAI